MREILVFFSPGIQEAGMQTIWRGLRRLDDLAAMCLLLHSSPPAGLTYGFRDIVLDDLPGY